MGKISNLLRTMVTVKFKQYLVVLPETVIITQFYILLHFLTEGEKWQAAPLSRILLKDWFYFLSYTTFNTQAGYKVDIIL